LRKKTVFLRTGPHAVEQRRVQRAEGERQPLQNC